MSGLFISLLCVFVFVYFCICVCVYFCIFVFVPFVCICCDNRWCARKYQITNVWLLDSLRPMANVWPLHRKCLDSSKSPHFATRSLHCTSHCIYKSIPGLNYKSSRYCQKRFLDGHTIEYNSSFSSLWNKMVHTFLAVIIFSTVCNGAFSR